MGWVMTTINYHLPEILRENVEKPYNFIKTLQFDLHQHFYTATQY